MSEELKEGEHIVYVHESSEEEPVHIQQIDMQIDMKSKSSIEESLHS
jgi:hypothetical protein